MLRETMTSELLAIRERAKLTVQHVDQIKCELVAGRLELRQAIKEYGAKWLELLKGEFETRELSWCTLCSTVVPVDEVEFLLVEGRAERSCGPEHSCYRFEDFSQLHRACLKCYEKAVKRNGTFGEFDSMANDQTSYHALQVELLPGGYFVCTPGSSVKLDDEKRGLPEIPSQLIERLVKEWDLPPRINLDYEADRLIIYGRVTATEQV